MNLSGKVGGLKSGQVKDLERLGRRRVKSDRVVSPEIAAAMARLSTQIRRQIGLLIGRDGTVYAVFVGDEREIILPDIAHFRFGKTALRGVRFVHTHFRNLPLTPDDLNDLAMLRFDLVAAIGLLPEGGVGSISVAHLLPKNPTHKIYEVLPPVPLHQTPHPLSEFLSALETELDGVALHQVEKRRERVVLVSASMYPRLDQESTLEELADLARSANLVPLDRMVQRLKKNHPKYLVGEGKLKEIVMTALQQRADLLIFDQQLSPLQVREIGRMTEMKVLDRTQLILDIFAQRAKTREAKVQVELAQLKYRLPRLSERSTSLSRLTGGIGGRGPGETRLEIDLRRARARMAALEKEHEALFKARDVRRSKRTDQNLPILSIVGYTNAGKSTLLNTLTHSQVETGSALFETLDTTTRRLRFPKEREVILTDTVGFIQSLPNDLLGAFRSTLDELRDAHLLIHLVDVSHTRFIAHIQAVETLLAELDIAALPRLLVFNKIDRCDPTACAAWCARYRAIPITAIQPESLAPLMFEIGRRLWPEDALNHANVST